MNTYEAIDAEAKRRGWQRWEVIADRRHRREIPRSPIPGDTRWLPLTPAQRTAVSAHWSAELRARISNAPKPGPQVVLDCAEEL